MKNEQIVLRYFLENARGGKTACDVFDACYETDLHCAELLPVLEALLAKGELERADIRTYRFIGSVEPRGWETAKESASVKHAEDVFAPEGQKRAERQEDFMQGLREWRESHEKRRRIVNTAKERALQEKRTACFAELRRERDRIQAKTEKGERVDDEAAERFYLRAKALRAVLTHNAPSLSFLQRNLRIGYNSAGMLLQWMEENGLISGMDGMPQSRTVLFTRAEFEENCLLQDEGEEKSAPDKPACTLLTIRALKWAIERGRINAALIRGRFSVGEDEANEMMSWMFERGYITSPQEALSTTLLTQAEFDRIFPFGGGEDGEGGAN